MNFYFWYVFLPAGTVDAMIAAYESFWDGVFWLVTQGFAIFFGGVGLGLTYVVGGVVLAAGFGGFYAIFSLIWAVASVVA